MDTIFAKSTGIGKAAIVIYRISGANSFLILSKLLGDNIDGLKFNKMYRRKLYIPQTNDLIDDAMVILFKAPHSFTGEDVVELHVHGSVAISKIINEVMLSLGKVRIADPGEFSKRAFINGKFDLTSAEGLADLIDAETALQHKQAIRQYEGGLENIYENWRRQTLQIISLIEAYIDFPEEEIPNTVLEQSSKMVNNLIKAIQVHLDDNNKGERLRNGIKVSIVGKPNVGKSSLLNFLLRREAAIVSDIPGTTRDILEGSLDIGGYPIVLQDTAGIRDNSNDLIEQEGIKRAINVANNCDIILLVTEVDDRYTNEILLKIEHTNIIKIVNKIDLVEDQVIKSINENNEYNLISLKQNIGLNALIEKIIEQCNLIANVTEEPTITRLRYRQQLNLVLEYLENFKINQDMILASEDIRLSMRALANITGKISVEEILGEIFSNFCIGK